MTKEDFMEMYESVLKGLKTKIKENSYIIEDARDNIIDEVSELGENYRDSAKDNIDQDEFQWAIDDIGHLDDISSDLSEINDYSYSLGYCCDNYWNSSEVGEIVNHYLDDVLSEIHEIMRNSDSAEDEVIFEYIREEDYQSAIDLLHEKMQLMTFYEDFKCLTSCEQIEVFELVSLWD